MVTTYILAFYCLAILFLCILFSFINLSNKSLKWVIEIAISIIVLQACNTRIQHDFRNVPYTPELNPTVYVTNTGDHYHSRDCGYLRKSSIPISLHEATLEEYYSCSRCDPPEYSSDERSLILSSAEPLIPTFDEFLMSYQYLGISSLIAVTLFCYFKFNLPEKARERGFLRFASFLDHICIFYGLFFLLGVLLIFMMLFVFGSVILLVCYPCQKIYHAIIIRKNHKKPVKATISSSNEAAQCKIEAIYSDSPQEQFHPSDSSASSTPAYQICSAIWTYTKILTKDSAPTKDYRIYGETWATFFYIAAKEIRKQTIVNEIYSHFFETGAIALADCHNVDLALSMCLSAYRECVEPFNNCGIDPRTEAGMDFLWRVLSARLYGNGSIPETAKKDFYLSTAMLRRRIARLYSKSSAPQQQQQMRYSISEANENQLPT